MKVFISLCLLLVCTPVLATKRGKCEGVMPLDEMYSLVRARHEVPVTDAQREELIKEYFKDIERLKKIGFQSHEGPIYKNADLLDGRFIVGIMRMNRSGAVEIFGGHAFGFDRHLGSDMIELYTTDRIMRQYPTDFIIPESLISVPFDFAMRETFVPDPKHQ